MTTCTYSHPVSVNGNEIKKGQVYAAISSLESGQLENYPSSLLFCQDVCTGRK